MVTKVEGKGHEQHICSETTLTIFAHVQTTTSKDLFEDGVSSFSQSNKRKKNKSNDD